MNTKYLIPISILLIFLIGSCKPEELLKITKLQTGTMSDVAETTAVASLEFIDVSGNISEFGHCWSIGENPGTLDSKFIINATSIKNQEYYSHLTGLTANTHYYIRAFARENEETIYGNIVEFTTLAYTPSLYTQEASHINYRSATLEGSVNANGGEVTVSFEWGETTSYGNSANASPLVVNGGVITRVSANITGLNHGTTYHFRLKADNSQDIYNGNDFTLTTIPETITDIDGNIYSTVMIGNQIWLSENLRVRRYQNGDFIGTVTPYYTDISDQTEPKYQWLYKDVLMELADILKPIIDGGYGNYTFEQLYSLGAFDQVTRDNLISYVTKSGIGNGTTKNVQLIYDECYSRADLYDQSYGLYYTWYAAVDHRNICPQGWHVPSDSEWKNLELFLGMSISDADMSGYRGTDQGDQLKEAGTSHWPNPNSGSNLSGFTAIPAGYRYSDATHVFFQTATEWWSVTESNFETSWSRGVNSSSGESIRLANSKKTALSVRCLKD